MEQFIVLEGFLVAVRVTLDSRDGFQDVSEALPRG
jgi:hypothetical protein